MNQDGYCLNCDKEIDENIIYCEKCYHELNQKRMQMVVQYQSQGYSFSKACLMVSELHEIDIEDIELLFNK